MEREWEPRRREAAGDGTSPADTAVCGLAGPFLGAAVRLGDLPGQLGTLGIRHDDRPSDAAGTTRNLPSSIDITTVAGVPEAVSSDAFSSAGQLPRG